MHSRIRTEEEPFRDAFLREELEDHIFFSCGVEDVALRLRLPRGIHLSRGKRARDQHRSKAQLAAADTGGSFVRSAHAVSRVGGSFTIHHRISEDV